ncbi:MAG: S-adenosylmethionine:tRNA ribosyltransferase-isomerase [Muribaculaceae bacterium]|nr:S-adenosylmethionine:tRNA ribosyltransferase-isomerase [Muribaculaceae bacterium]
MVKNLRDIRIADYDYQLPEERIALHPVAERDKCKLLVHNPDRTLVDTTFDNITNILPDDSVLIYNNTRVINARLRFHKAPTMQGPGAIIEIFCLEPASPRDYALSFASKGKNIWTCLVGNSKKWKSGPLSLNITLKDGRSATLTATRISKNATTSEICFNWDADLDIDFASLIEAAGEIPIPPYLNRSTEASDSDDYQTVYSRFDGSVAAPTAGLHFTTRLLEDIDKRGIQRRELTLHVGAGTFKPVTADTIGDHPMHSEWISVSQQLIRELADTERTIIAVGTTSVRTLESLYHLGCMIATDLEPTEVPQWYPYSPTHPGLSRQQSLTTLATYMQQNNLDQLIASTRIMIAPGYKYRIVDGMVTNFHQPRSTLLLLVSAFIGDDWKILYDHALSATDYRFLSYGDACLLFPSR